MSKKQTGLNWSKLGPDERAEIYDRVAAEEETEPTKRLNAEIPESLHREFKVLASEIGVSMSELLREMLRTFLRE